MDKLRSLYAYISGINFAYSLILALVVKSIIFDISYASFLLALPVLGFESYKLYIKHKTPDPVQINQDVMAELDKLKSKINAGQVAKNLEAATQTKRYF
jgi:hypothetical protein